MLEEAYYCTVVVDGKAVKAGIVYLPIEKHPKLIAFVKKEAAEKNGIGQIHHDGTLVYECNATGERTGGTWESGI